MKVKTMVKLETIKTKNIINTIINDDSIRIMNAMEENSVDLIFADPPYALENLTSIPDAALPLLKEGGLMILEHGVRDDFSNHPRFIEHRNYGSVNFSFFR